MGEEARGYSWAPFAPGHELSMKSGAYSARKVDPIAVELSVGIVELRPDLAAPEFMFAVHAWARAEARCILLADWLVDRVMVADDGEPLPMLISVARFEKQAADLRARLGLDPRAKAELDRQRVEATRSAVDLDAVRAAGRTAIDARASEQGAQDAGELEQTVGDGEGGVEVHEDIVRTRPRDTP